MDLKVGNFLKMATILRVLYEYIKNQDINA